MASRLFYELIAFRKRNPQKRAGIINFVIKFYTSNLFYLMPNLLQVILHKTYIYEIFFVEIQDCLKQHLKTLQYP